MDLAFGYTGALTRNRFLHFTNTNPECANVKTEDVVSRRLLGRLIGKSGRGISEGREATTFRHSETEIEIPIAEACGQPRCQSGHRIHRQKHGR